MKRLTITLDEVNEVDYVAIFDDALRDIGDQLITGFLSGDARGLGFWDLSDVDEETGATS